MPTARPSLPNLLRQARQPADLGPVFRELGYRQADAPYDDATRVIARWRGFSVIAAEGTPPAERARSIARTLARRGDRGLVVCVGGDQLAVAAPKPGSHDATRALTIDLSHPSALTLTQLQALRPGRSATALAHTIRVADALSAEAAGDRFFRGFRAVWHRMSDALDHAVAPADRRLIALLTLTRVLFLYFVQAKGWLENDPSYLRSLLDRTLAANRDFHRHALTPLFFQTLNRPVRARARDTPNIPYLNGGLFQPHPIEQGAARERVSIPNSLWIDAFDGLFERYRFCVREAHVVDAIAPDMLGRVFERLMESDERSRTGTYFTPEALVRDIVRDALLAFLSDGAPDDSPASRLVDGAGLSAEERQLLARRLRHITVLDPAAGSGAFLLGALDILTELNLRVREVADEHERWTVRRRVLRENLFGVDINPVAVRLAELRLWLAVVADDPSTSPVDVEPLPNLDGIMRQGDTLVDPVGAAHAHGSAMHPAPPALARRVAESRRRLFGARGSATTRALQLLREAEQDLASHTVDHAITVCRHQLREIRALQESPDLWGDRVAPSAEAKRRRRTLEADLADLTRARAETERGVLPFFSFEIHAPEVMACGGFDLVLGNPPWVRAERLPPRTRARLRERFTLWQAGGERGYRHSPDLAVAFLERALELAAPGGTVALLLPGKLVTAGYGDALRRHLRDRTTILRLHRIPDADAQAFGATTYPLACVVRKADPVDGHRTLVGSGSTAWLSQHRLPDRGPWILIPDAERDAVELYCAAGAPLGTVAEPHLGVKTGADRLLVGSITTQHGGEAQVRFPAAGVIQIETEALRPGLRGRDVQRFGSHPRCVVLWGHDASGAVRPSLPPHAAAYVAARAKDLRERADYRSGPVWQVFRTGPAVELHRVVWPDIARRIRAVAIDQTDPDSVPLNTCYVSAFPTREAALAATCVLNSSWSAAFVTVAADEARGGFRRCNARIVGRIPMPDQRHHATLAALALRAHEGDYVSADEVDAAVAASLDLPSAVCSRLASMLTRR